MVSSSSTWRASAAYLYLLHVDGAALAWEYLRRHPEYRRDWQERNEPNALHWGLASLENPHLDARFAQPLWRPCPVGLVRLTGSDEPILNLERFNLWRLPGGKSLIHDGRVLLLILVLGSQVLRVALAPSVTEGSAFAYVIPATANASPIM